MDFKSSLGMPRGGGGSSVGGSSDGVSFNRIIPGQSPPHQTSTSTPSTPTNNRYSRGSDGTPRFESLLPRGSEGLSRGGSDGFSRVGSDGMPRGGGGGGSDRGSDSMKSSIGLPQLSPTLSSRNEHAPIHEAKIMNTLNKIPDMYQAPSFEARKTALDFMRSHHRTEQLNQIEGWLDELNDHTDDIVDVYFQGFNKSIHNYSRILQYMGDSHSNAITMSKEVEEINKLIYFNNSNIDRLWRRNLEYYYMIQILEKMEELKKVPDLLEGYVKGNHFVHASNLVVNSLNALNEKDLVNVNALMDLRQSLSEKKEEFNDLIVDKLNDHVYLKSIKNDEDDEDDLFDFKSNLKKALSINSPLPTPQFKTNQTTQKNNHQNNKNISSPKEDDEQPLELELISKQSNSIEDLNLNPETNGKLFMNLLVESLSVLDYLEPAVGLILGKISIELRNIVNTCSNTVTLKYQSEGRAIPRVPGEGGLLTNSNGADQLQDHTFNLLLGDHIHKTDSTIPLVDLLKAIFSKIMMVFKNHMTLSIIVNESIKKRQENKRRHQFHGSLEISADSLNSSGQDSSNSDELYSVGLVWEIMQKEIREMLRIHLHDTSSLLLRTNSTLLDQSKTSSVRLFSFSNSIVTESWNGSTSPLSSPTIGVGSGGGLNNSTGITNAVSIFKASQYNVTPIYPMIVKFTDQIDSIMTGKKPRQELGLSKDDGSPKGLLRLYIDDFVHRNFLQHIKNDYKERVTAAIEGPDAFKPLERFKLAFKLRDTKPILNSTLQIYQFITELHSDIVAMSHYVEEFGAIIQTSLLRYKEKCLTKFTQELEPTLTGALMNHPELFKYLQNQYDNKRQEIPKFQNTREEDNEYRLESDLFTNQERPVQKSQLLLDLEKLTMLANLNYSLEWLADRVSNLFWPQINSTATPTMAPTKDNDSSQPSTPAQKGKTPAKSKQPPVLQKLSPEVLDSLRSIDFIIQDLRDLAKRCLIGLRIEYRIHCFYFLEGFKKGSYICDEERTDPDTFIVELNKDLSTNEESMSTYLSSDKCQFLFGGIAKLIGKLLINRLVHIKQLNINGVAKLCKNVYTLQQNLTNIIVKREMFFDRIRQFYQSLSNEDELLTYLLEKMIQPYFTTEEARIIIDFLSTTKRISGNATQTLEAKFKLM
ncbi:exocyst complex subunit 4 [Cavenderia fasciculata]|uniref:Exocyst complex component Sec8 n=1 Tax=Cavenderia fasciculata TaxID=261658 RepID=F4Q1C7_CACFS|nr:exocyst complex subunit 4 [Cavenderia fasciculata]EGG18628.1 exocyst complex subunit 4 [Cavenderia fasciculata]|eukprot:XP_004366532.1 exocyst complex subunit 4 [Cavenderia fasciculata]